MYHRSSALDGAWNAHQLEWILATHPGIPFEVTQIQYSGRPLRKKTDFSLLSLKKHAEYVRMSLFFDEFSRKDDITLFIQRFVGLTILLKEWRRVRNVPVPIYLAVEHIYCHFLRRAIEIPGFILPYLFPLLYLFPSVRNRSPLIPLAFSCPLSVFRRRIDAAFDLCESDAQHQPEKSIELRVGLLRKSCKSCMRVVWLHLHSPVSGQTRRRRLRSFPRMGLLGGGSGAKR